MIYRAYLRVLVLGILTSGISLFSRVLVAQAPSIPQTVGQLPPSSERWALIIGVNKYDDKALNPLYGQNDARKIASDLEQYAGFEHDQVIVLSDDQPDDRRPKRERILWWLSDLKKNASPQGLLFVFFSGHGMEVEGEDFLMPQDAHLSFDKYYLEQNAIPVESVSKPLRESLSKQVVVLVDACRNNPYQAAGTTANKMTSKFAESFDYEKRNSGIKAYATILSTSPGEESFQYDNEKMGFFSWVLDHSLQGAYSKNGPITLQSVINDLQEHVPRLASEYNPGRKQVPDYRIGGYFANRLVLVAAPPARASAFPSVSQPTTISEFTQPAVDAVLKEYSVRLDDLDTLVYQADANSDIEIKGADSILIFRIVSGADEYRPTQSQFKNVSWASLIRNLEVESGIDSSKAIKATQILIAGPYIAQDTHNRGYFGPGVLDEQAKSLRAFYNDTNAALKRKNGTSH